MVAMCQNPPHPFELTPAGSANRTPHLTQTVGQIVVFTPLSSDRLKVFASLPRRTAQITR
jgi:hypothetical protein